MDFGKDIQLYNEDCFATLKRLGPGVIDLMLQDPPYGVTRNKWDQALPLDLFWPEWSRTTKSNGAMLFFGQQPFVTSLISSAANLFRYDLIWQKTTPTGFLNAGRMPLRSHEHILVFYKQLPTYNPQKSTGHQRKVSTVAHQRSGKKSPNYGKFDKSDYDSTDRYPRSVLLFKTDKQKSALHPTQKPLELIRWLVRTYSNIGDLVFDGFSGSGTTALTCILEHRRFIGSELDPHYYELACARLKAVADAI